MQKKKNSITLENFIKFKSGLLQNDYKMIKKITEATFGSIYIVEHIITGQKRCLKVYNKKKMENTNQNKFEEELNLVKKFDHPNIFTIYEFFQDSKNHYLITEYLEGGELFDFISSKNVLSEHEAFIIFEQLISSLNYLHKRSIIHRDLKPENLMLAKSQDINSVKLIDFGTSTSFKEKDLFNIPLGTVYYVAPEVIRRSYDHKADVWSCGIILYILLCGYPPFNGEKDVEIYKRILKQKLIFDKDDWKNVSKEAQDLIKNMLKKYPCERYDIEDCLNHEWFKQFSMQKKSQSFDRKIVLNNLKNFNIKNKLEKALRLFLATQFEFKEKIRKLKQVFKDLDIDHDGSLNKQELELICQQSQLDFDIDINKVIEIIDLNQDNQVNFSEFLMATFDIRQTVTFEHIQQLFNQIDNSKDGYISKSELQYFLGLEGDDEQLNSFIDYVDKNKDKKISFKEFKDYFENHFLKDNQLQILQLFIEYQQNNFLINVIFLSYYINIQFKIIIIIQQIFQQDLVIISFHLIQSIHIFFLLSQVQFLQNLLIQLLIINQNFYLQRKIKFIFFQQFFKSKFQ